MPGSNSKARGFTIVEVLFVLGIGGLILSMIFFAIPAISRWNQNNQRKAEVSAILQAVSEYRLQNSANYPVTPIPPASPSLQYRKLINSLNPKLKLYKSNINFKEAIEPVDYIDAINRVDVYNHARCSLDGNATIYSGSRDIVALYATDNGGDTGTPQCRQL